MTSREEAAAFFRAGYQEFVPHLSVDCVVFGFHGGELKLLLLQWKQGGGWSLPGGYVRRAEPVDEAAHRILRERTGLEKIYLQQYHTFGGTRRKEETLGDVIRGHGFELPEDAWFLERVVSVGYYALVDFTGTTPTPDFYSEKCAWCDVRERPALLFDHDEMVERALRTLRLALRYRPIGPNLLPDKFTMPELQKLYETVLGRTLDRRNFQKKVLELGIIERLPERRTGGAHRSPYLYRFHMDRYEQALAGGLSFGY